MDIGIKLEDKPTGGVWLRMDPEELRKEVRATRMQRMHAVRESHRSKRECASDIGRAEYSRR